MTPSMYPFLRAIFFELLGMWSAYYLWKNLKTGIIDTGRGWTIDRRENPAGFWAYTLFGAFFVVFAIAVLLNAIGLTGDPFAWINRTLPSVFR
jgi:hypothetical protein